MGRATRVLRSLLIVTAFFGTPVLMFVGYYFFSSYAAVSVGVMDIQGDYLEGLAVALLILVLIFFLPLPAAHGRALALLWLVRIGISLGAMLVFEAFYPGDLYAFYQGGKSLSDPLAYFTFGDGTKNIQASVGILSQFVESYSGIKVVFSFIGLAAIYIFYRAATICIGQEQIALLYALGLFPSLLLWSSLLGKEPIVLFAIALYSYGVAGLMVRRRALMLALVAAGILLATAIRVWLGVIFVTPVIVSYVMAGRRPLFLKLGFLVVAIPMFLFAMQGFADKFRIDTARDLVRVTDVLSESWARGGSAQQIQAGFGSIESMITFLPIGAFTALFRPLPFEIQNPFGVVAGLENAFLLYLILIGLWRRGVTWLGHPILLWAATTLLVWASIYGFVSYQNLGTAFRWRSQLTPILLLLGLYLAYAHLLKGPEAEQRSEAPPAVGGAPPRLAQSEP